MKPVKSMLRLTILFCFVLNGSLSVLNAQVRTTDSKERLVSVHLTNVDIKEVLESIKRQTNIQYSDFYGILREGKKVSVNADSISVAELLKNISKDQVFDVTVIYTISVHLKPQWAEKLRKGYVFDQKGKPVPDVTVAYRRTGLATFTTSKGSFYLNDIKPYTRLEVYGSGIKDKVYWVGKDTLLRIQVEREIAAPK